MTRLTTIVVQSYLCESMGTASSEQGKEHQAEMRTTILITQTRPCNIQQYFTAVKMFIFRRFFKNIFLVFAQNIDCGYTLEPPH